MFDAQKPTITISVTDLCYISACERTLWLNLHGDPRSIVPVLPAVILDRKVGKEHEQAVIRVEMQQARVVPIASWADGVVCTREAMAAGSSIIAQAYLEGEWFPGVMLRGRPDLLIRATEGAPDGSWLYYPVEIKQHGSKPRVTDILQLTAYQWLLREYYSMILPGTLRIGDTTIPWDGSFLPLDSMIPQVQALIEPDVPAPPPHFQSFCAWCGWRNACDKVAQSTGDLMILPNMDARTRTKLRLAGITTITQLQSLSAHELARFPYVGARASFYLQYAESLATGHIVALNPETTESLPQISLFFDLETDPVTQQPWAFGWGQSPENWTILIVDADRSGTMKCAGAQIIFVKSIDMAWEYTTEAVLTNPGVLAHWSRYEYDSVNRFAPTTVRSHLLSRLHDVQVTLKERFILPLPRTTTQSAYTLKSVGSWLGITWPATISRGDMTWYLWQRWCKDGHLSDLMDVISYHVADLNALHAIWRLITDDKHFAYAS